MKLFGRRRDRKHGFLHDGPVEGSRCTGCVAVSCRSFVSVELTAAEYRLLQELGARRLEFTLTGRHYLDIEDGCEFLRDDRCSIYPHRPDICRRFSCQEPA